MSRWILLGAAIVSEVAGSLALKAALGHPGWYALVVIGYAAAFVLILRALKAGLGLGVAYGIWGAMGVALTALFGAVLFGEIITAVMVLGLVLVVGGVLLVQLGSQRALAARAEQEVAG
ncbi:MAG TPA: SMR family transporter [Ruania sp.]|nr:SMR family transporter [Ruania sp.]